jgi:hypothetical protein
MQREPYQGLESDISEAVHCQTVQLPRARHLSFKEHKLKMCGEILSGFFSHSLCGWSAKHSQVRVIKTCFEAEEEVAETGVVVAEMVDVVEEEVAEMVDVEEDVVGDVVAEMGDVEEEVAAVVEMVDAAGMTFNLSFLYLIDLLGVVA